MPLHTLMHGGLILDKKHYPHGSEVELSLEQAAQLTSEGTALKLSALIKAEAEAEKGKAEHLAKLTSEIDAKLKSEKSKGGAK